MVRKLICAWLVLLSIPCSADPSFTGHWSDYVTDESQYDDFVCLAQNIYFEARDQTLEGKISVGLVTFNRVDHKYFPDSVCEVVWQRKQFSWTHDGKSDTPREKEAWEEIKSIASAMIDPESTIHDFTNGATHYHAAWMEEFPDWAETLAFLGQIDDHLMYK